MGKFLIKIFIGTILAGIYSCTSDGCLDNQSSIPLAGFYSAETNNIATLDSIEIYGIGATGDSLLTTIGTAAQQAYLPFRSTLDSTIFCIHYGYADLSSALINDTICFNYNSTPYFASEECGAMYNYKITSVQYTRHIIDSVAIIDSLINNADIECIKIYFRTN